MSSSPAIAASTATWRLARLCLATFGAYLAIALPLPVLPVFVRDTMHQANVMVGAVIGVQFVATVLTRGLAGRIADTAGPAKAMRRGCVLLAVSGVTYLAAGLLPGAALGLLIAGRLAAGVGESLLVTGMLAWGIGTVGQPRAGRVMTWVGLAIFASLAVGAPIGVTLADHFGFAAVAVACLLVPLVALALTGSVPATTPVAGARLPLRDVLGRIALPALGLALQGMGFASISAFAVLYFNDQHWSGAALALSAFGGGFVLSRLLLARTLDRFGGARVAMVSMIGECVGLALLAMATTPTLALVGAFVAGMGCSLVFPALGVVVVQRVPPQMRATALGGYAAFQDIAYAITGPVAGIVATHFGYAAIFAMAAASAACGVGVALSLQRRTVVAAAS
ncbi:Predicted arabinose efflux permease, MFS family [Pseudoxanthomonas sp. GM95]|uniref:arabinose transporter n=1 Tax=Pseudoxanthomonas sp. GM95 TaxID=1881043 RepID=UPI0008BC7F38|nr:arabinose transporter [Pseudoxanthomonas sp. GM95]SEM36848.1 Predicted arabinose efflux permease, MFS family [Pseudoxanthomonas sp. GM95]